MIDDIFLKINFLSIIKKNKIIKGIILKKLDLSPIKNDTRVKNINARKK